MTIQDADSFCTGQFLDPIPGAAEAGVGSVARVEVTQLGVRDWATLRAARLAALRTSPTTLCGNHGRERRALPGSWQTRLEDQAWTVARLPEPAGRGRIVGLAGMHPDDPVSESHPSLETGCVVSVWTAPDLRCRGVMSQVLDAVEANALRRGVGTSVLWVLDSNPMSALVYARRGYRFVRRAAQPIMVHGRQDVERQMIKNLI